MATHLLHRHGSLAGTVTLETFSTLEIQKPACKIKQQANSWRHL